LNYTVKFPKTWRPDGAVEEVGRDVVKVWSHGADDAAGNGWSRGRGRGAQHKSGDGQSGYAVALSDAGELIVVAGF
jgi:hypothetical protein